MFSLVTLKLIQFMKHLTTLFLLIVFFTLASNTTQAQAESKFRFAQIVVETPDSIQSNVGSDITFMSISGVHSVQIRYGTDTQIDQYYNQIYTLNSTTSLTHNLLTDEGLHTYVSIGNYTLSPDNIMTISLLDASGAVLENKQFK